MSSPRVRPRPEAGKVGGEQSYELRNYRLTQRIEQDELATVYRATHLTLGRPVHVHLLRRTDWVSVSRFQLAGRLAARLSHPGLQPVVDAGHDDRYGDYLVTPMLEASTLASMLAKGPLEPVLALKIASQLAATIDYLHSQGVIHRDVQPGNVLVNPQGVAYLTNLSLASSADTPDLSSIDEADYLTPYSAPEQKLDKSATTALDIYGLGAVLFHMLSGQQPPPPGQPLPSLATRDAALSSADRPLQRMMAAQPAQRFPSATSAITAVRQSLRSLIDLTTEDMEESRWETSAEWLENPAETVLGDALDEKFKDFIARSRRRADELHRRDAIRRLLNRWSRAGFFRRQGLGQLAQPEQIVSYNIYHYELRVVYETRTTPQPRQRSKKPEDRNATLSPPDLWAVPVPESDPFVGIKPTELALPNSTRVLSCTECAGAGTLPCKECKGSGTVERLRKVPGPDNSTKEERLVTDCAACRGYGKIKCERCEGMGSLVEEQIFTWSRRGKLWQSTDDYDDLPKLAIQKRLEPIHESKIDPYEGRWHSVAPIATVLRTAIGEVADQMRIIAAELKISGAPITEVDYTLDEKPHQFHIVGFDNEIIGDWALINPERLALAALGAVVIIAVFIFLLMTFL
jgi:eukaryotic-like serine/threonine-protein kinase